MNLADDRTSSATVLLEHAADVLKQARSSGPAATREAARAVCAGQPAMGALWNLAALALEDDPGSFERFLGRARRAPAVVPMILSRLLAGEARRVVTCSRSAIVEGCACALGAPVVCAESRPRLEGRALAQALAGRGLDVVVVSDAAIASDLRQGDVVLVGADAVARQWFVNKVGTGALCAAAELAGVPAYAVTGREKFVVPEVAQLLRLRDDAPEVLWPDPPEGVRVLNPLFERIPIERIAGVVTDAGLLAGSMVAAACEAMIPPAAARRLVDLLTKA